ncbi:DUF488 domain-containing protein [Roseateles saccharophilus]|uniref:Uncharacterized protein YeaO (DUF488 family) n=1 Tax=Roseateles saccharophilus TaxID=304 RepID=A0A4V2VSZ4_ROSSA|nr:DUF488 family protein [Roseateles saccharophilus]MDG0831130.1 DUF488 family protein [Roseateles saccharophilus]TCV04250.1 uncharacterized protein YeaO (DUF488 family) [Roseateles saccharophilus]
MSIRIVQLGSPRAPDEGSRIGTVRRPPRGVPKAEFASRDFYDVWFPNLAPSIETMKLGQAAETPADWLAFTKKYRREMAEPEAQHAIALLATLSAQTNFSVGCYCQDEAKCHRSVLRALLQDAGARLAP